MRPPFIPSRRRCVGLERGAIPGYVRGYYPKTVCRYGRAPPVFYTLDAKEDTTGSGAPDTIARADTLSLVLAPSQPLLSAITIGRHQEECKREREF